MKIWLVPVVVLPAFAALYVIASKSPADKDHWVGGIFYVNRENPRLLIPKRYGIGIGTTPNLGRPAARLILAAPFLIAALSSAARTR